MYFNTRQFLLQWQLPPHVSWNHSGLYKDNGAELKHPGSTHVQAKVNQQSGSICIAIWPHSRHSTKTPLTTKTSAKPRKTGASRPQYLRVSQNY
jgi:hypothetical protein